MALSDNIVLLSTADWHNPIWTNKQHVAITLAKKGRKVLYIDSLGLRNPSANKKDIRRIIKRLFHCLKSPQAVRDNLWVWSPLVLPWQNNAFIRYVNALLLQKWLGLWLRYLSMSKCCLWTYNPLTTELLDISSFPACIYHCVDEIKEQPGMPADLIAEKEAILLRNANIVFVSSTTLYESRKSFNHRTYYFPNVVDYDHFHKATITTARVPEDLNLIGTPRLGFIGALSPYKIDFSLLVAIAKLKPNWSIILIGPLGEGEPNSDDRMLREEQNIYILGEKKYCDLPLYMKGLDVAMLPNNINNYTEAMFPMKFFEYLAAGLPVIGVNLSALREYRDLFYQANSPEEFVAQADLLISDSSYHADKQVAGLAAASGNTYAARTSTMLNLIDKLVEQECA